MNPTAVILVLLSAAIHVGWNYLTKASASPRAFSLLKGTILMALGSGALAMAPLGALPAVFWLYVLASGFVHFVYILALSTAYESGDISYVYPIARSAPALVPLAAFIFLGERISARGGLGIAVVVVAVVFLQLRGGVGGKLSQVRASLVRADSRWAFLTLGAVVTYTLIDKAAMVMLSTVPAVPAVARGPLFFVLEMTLTYLFFWAYLLSRGQLPLIRLWRGEWLRGLTAAVGTLASYSLILHVMQTEPVSYVVTLRQASVLLAVVAGALGLQEPYGRRRLFASAGMLIGFYLVATA